MKFALSFAAGALLLGGCQSPRTSPPRPAPAPALAIDAGLLRLPETVRAYALGAYVDTDDPAVRHTAHEIHRIERPARWQLGAPPEKREPATPPSPLPAPTPTLTVQPSPAPTPIAPPPIAPLPTSEVAPAIPVPDVPVAPAQVPEQPLPDLVPALTPNADGLVDFAAPAASLEPDDVNPFAVRATAATPPREIKLIVSGLVGGPTPGAIINGVPLRLGDPIESLVLERVETETVLLRSGERRVRLPVSGTSYRLRLAP